MCFRWSAGRRTSKTRLAIALGGGQRYICAWAQNPKRKFPIMGLGRYKKTENFEKAYVNFRIVRASKAKASEKS